MVYILLFAIFSVAKLTFPISTIEKVIEIHNEDMNVNGNLKLSAIPFKQMIKEEFMVKLGFGYPPQMMNLYLSLSIDFSLISGINCTCHLSENKYTPYISPHFSIDSVHYTYYIYGSYFKGYWVLDDILIEKKFSRDFSFFMVTSDNATNAFHSDGILGLGLSINTNFNILSYLKNQGLIASKIFSIYINNPNRIKKQSCLTLGYWDTFEYSQVKSTKKLKVLENSFDWRVHASSIFIDGILYTYSQNILFDFNIQTIKLTASHFDNAFRQYISESADCTEYKLIGDRTTLICNCTGEFPVLGYGTDYDQFYIHKEDYLRREKNGLCTVLIERDPNIVADIIGLPFFKAYYTMFDAENRYIYFREAITYEYIYNKHSFVVYQGGMAVIVLVAITLGVIYVKKEEIIQEESYQRMIR